MHDTPSQVPTDARRPLSGIRVIDMTTVLMGPVATQTLADYGADVIKVEPLAGDVMRNAGHKHEEGMGPIFIHANRNKRSVALDIKQPEGREALLALVRTADVFIHNVRPAAMARAGLGDEDLRAQRPGLVYVALTGYGSRGPYAGRAAVDDVIQAAVGLPSLFAQAGNGPPAFMPFLMADRMVGITAVHAVMAALFHRLRTGEGQAVEVPMYETMASYVLGDHAGGRSFDPPAGPTGYNRLLSPSRRPYATKDGYLVVTMYTDAHWRSFFEAIGRGEEFRADPRFHDTATRYRSFDDVYAALAAILPERTSAEWIAIFKRSDIPYVPLATIDDLLDDEHIGASKLLVDVDYGYTVRTPGPPTIWSSLDVSARTPAPRLGEHTEAVLREAGLPGDAVRGLVERGIAKSSKPLEVTKRRHDA